MTIQLADRVRETTTTTGTGTVDLAGAATGFQGFVAGAGDGEEVYYSIVGQAGGGAEGEWEVGIGTVTDASPDTLSRTTVLASSNSDALVNLSSGTKDVFLTYPAARASKTVWAMEDSNPSAAASASLTLPAYDLVKVVGYLLPASDGVDLFLRVSDDGGSTFEADAGDYAWGSYAWNMSTGGAADAQDASDTEMQTYPNTGSAAGEGVFVNVDIIMANQAAISTVLTGFMVHYKTDGAPIQSFFHGVVNVAAVNDAVQFLFSSGNIASGHIVAYGYPSP